MESFRFRGFTLVELMVVLAIIVTISGVVLSSQSSFNKTLVLANTAYDIALTLRSAETYGLGSRAAGAIANAGYGVHFERGAQGSFVLFSDIYSAVPLPSVCHPTDDVTAPDARPGDCVYQSDHNEKVVDYTLGNGITVSDFCAQSRFGIWSCALGAGGISSLDIVFSRPNPTPLITVNNAPGTLYAAACLKVASPHGETPRYITVAASGQIIADAAPCGS